MADTTTSKQKEWIITCDMGRYDIDNALKALKIIDWQQPKQMNSAQVGDLVYVYCKTKDVGRIRFKGAILKVNKTDSIIDDSRFVKDGGETATPCFTLAMFREYTLADDLTYNKLADSGLKSRLQGPVIVKDTVADYLHACDDKQLQIDRFDGNIPDTCLAKFPISIHEIIDYVALDDSHTPEEKEEHAESLEIDALKRIAQKQQKKEPKTVTSTVTQRIRDPYIAEYAKKRANGICQLCGNSAPFNKANGEPYLESHHIEWLSNGGEDSIDNTVALCPNCHRKIHILANPSDIEKLKASNK